MRTQTVAATGRAGGSRGTLRRALSAYVAGMRLVSRSPGAVTVSRSGDGGTATSEFLHGESGLFFGGVGCWAFLSFKHSRRLKAFKNQLADTLQLMSGALSAGLSLAQSVDTVVREGHQPMANEDGSVVVVFNGEIYNFPSLYEELVAKGVVWHDYEPLSWDNERLGTKLAPLPSECARKRPLWRPLREPLKTPAERIFAFTHTGDPDYPSFMKNWAALGIPGPLTNVDNAQPPYSDAHQLITSAPLSVEYMTIVFSVRPFSSR